jgi:hypothetical protein
VRPISRFPGLLNRVAGNTDRESSVKNSVDFDKLEPMSQNAFAKFAGVSSKQASIWKSKGYLDFTKEGLVDTKESAITLMGRGLGNFSAIEDRRDSEVVSATSDAKPLPTSEEEADAIIGELSKTVLLSYAESERLERYFYALRIRLIYEKESGKLVDKDEVGIEFSKVLAEIRQSWENWPSAVCADMAQELGVKQRKLRIVLERYVRNQVNAYVSSLEEEEDDDESEDA